MAGFDNQNGAYLILMMLAIGSATIFLIFSGTLAGSTYTLVHSDIVSVGITDVVNESFTVGGSGVWVAVAHNPLLYDTVKVYNQTGYDNTTDFTINATDGTLLTTNTSLAGMSFTCTYTWGSRTMQNYIQYAIAGGFKGLKVTGQYIPLILLAFIIAFVLTLVVGMGMTSSGYTQVTGGNRGYGGVL